MGLLLLRFDFGQLANPFLFTALVSSDLYYLILYHGRAPMNFYKLSMRVDKPLTQSSVTSLSVTKLWIMRCNNRVKLPSPY